MASRIDVGTTVTRTLNKGGVWYETADPTIRIIRFFPEDWTRELVAGLKGMTFEDSRVTWEVIDIDAINQRVTVRIMI